MKTYSLTKSLNKNGGEKIIACLISIFFLLCYVGTQSSSIYGGDAGDLVTAAYVKGVAHPPGYPLYTFIGWLLAKIPYSTIAWRVGLLSSVPMAVSIGLFFLISSKITKDISSSVISSFSFGFTYLVWLYATVPEVFGMQIFFVLLLLYILILFIESGNIKYIYYFAFVFGVSLTHHHTILFILPAYFLLLLLSDHQLKNRFRVVLTASACILIGLIPYIYVIYAARSNPPVNWENPQSFAGFVRLVTRSIYGTYKSGYFSPLSPFDRYFQLKNTVETVILDFSKLGVVLFITGAIVHFRKNKRYFFCILSFFLLSGPFFIFYASFPVALNFYLGTVERFFLVPYIFLYIWVGFGVAELSRWISILIRKFSRVNIPSVYILTLLPLALLFINLPKFTTLKNDRTAENLALDILNSTPDKAILIIGDDTSIFNTEYVYFTTGGFHAWRGIKLLQLGTLSMDFYKHNLKYLYDEIKTSKWIDSEDVLKALIEENYGKVPIVSSVAVPVGADFVWIPRGLVKQLFAVSDVAKYSVDEFIQQNENLFSHFSDPVVGALSQYTHVMLADVLRVYSINMNDFADALVKLGKYGLAEKYYRQARLLQPEILDLGLKEVSVMMTQKKCIEAEQLSKNLDQKFRSEPKILKLLSTIYQDCFSDSAQAGEYEKLYQESIKYLNTDLLNF